MPEIGLSGLLLDSPHSGTATYTRQLVKHLPVVAPDLDYCLLTSRATLEVPHIRLRTPLDGATGAAGTRLRKLVWESVALPAASALRRQAVLHSLYFAAPPVSSAPLVVTIHDLIPLIMPGHHRGRAAALYSEVMARTVKRADAVITVSQHSSEDIERVLGIPRERIFVTPEAAGEEFSTHAGPGERESVVSKYVLPDRFVLYMGGAERRKNLELLLRAWSRQKKRLRNLETRLVIVARLPEPDSLYPDTRRRTRELRLE
ncbi:MAG: glycosyltransferase, partial [Chloroflexota bacterium]